MVEEQKKTREREKERDNLMGLLDTGDIGEQVFFLTVAMVRDGG